MLPRAIPEMEISVVCFLLCVVRGVSGVDSVSRIFTLMAYTGAPYFPMGRQKTGPTNFTKFSGFVGEQSWTQ